MIFKDRLEAGRRLAGKLVKYKGQSAVVYALPRGGVVLGAEIAKELGLPLSLAIVRKIGHPFNREYAIAAVAEDGTLVENSKEVADIDPGWFSEEREKERLEAGRRREKYLEGREPLSASGKTAIIVDDGVATGLTLRLAVKMLRGQKPEKVVVAVPVLPKELAEEFRNLVDELVVVFIPEEFLGAVGAYYEDFPQVSDREVIGLLAEARRV